MKVEQETVDELDRIAMRLGLRRSQLIRNYIELGLDITHGYEKMGVVKLVEVMRRSKDLIKKETKAPLFRNV